MGEGLRSKAAYVDGRFYVLRKEAMGSAEAARTAGMAQAVRTMSITKAPLAA